jgi:hypothetical protein
MDPTLTDCVHPHKLFISAVLGHSSRVEFRYWTSSEDSGSSHLKSLMLSTQLKPESLQLFQGYKELGSFILPIAGASLHYTQSKVEDKGVDISRQDAEFASQILPLLSEQLLPGPDKKHSSNDIVIRLCTITVLSDMPETIISASSCPIWKWAKPSSPYRQSGFWETGLERVVEDGEWSAGKNLTLLVRGVSREIRDEIANSTTRYVTVPRDS